MNNLNIELIKIFIAVSRFHSFSRAGNYLYMDPSTVSKKIRQLEKIFHQQLFTRNSQGVELRTAGLNLKNKSQHLLDDLKSLSVTPQINWELLRIGILDNIAAYHYSNFIAQHLNDIKHLQISVKGIDLVKHFNDGQLDAIIINEENQSDIEGEFLENKLFQEGFALVSSQSALPSALSLKQITSSKLLIAPRYCPVSQQLLNIFNSSDDLKQIGHTNTLLEVIANSDYQTILPMQMAKTLTTNNHRFQASELTDFPPRTISLFSRTEDVQNFLVSYLG